LGVVECGGALWHASSGCLPGDVGVGEALGRVSVGRVSAAGWRRVGVEPDSSVHPHGPPAG
jgi:hypothetical protein